MNNKNLLRFTLKKQRDSIPNDVYLSASQAICDQLCTHKSLQSPYIAAYLPFQNEVNLFPFLDHCITQKRTVFVPHFYEDHYRFSRLDTLASLKKGQYGILEPSSPPTHTLEDIHALTPIWLVPGLGFDLTGTRLGMGKGYYDTFLKKAKGLKIGICYQFQLINTIPKDPWDIPMDIVITEQGTNYIAPQSKAPVL